MPFFTKESLELVKSRVDLVDIVSSHIDLKRTGSTFKACCPFHEEKSPSFVVQRGDHHYHCFGCGAHGDAIHFLMDHLKMSFKAAIEYLAERVQVSLQTEEEGEQKGPNKALLKDALDTASRFFHFMLLHTQEGHAALKYLYDRGLDLDFIRTFQVGLAPKSSFFFKKTMHAFKFADETLFEAGLLAQTKNGEMRDFFSDRITFPIRNSTGSVIGFSARKYKEDTFGGKYINTPETPLFKKSNVLFGINYSRKKIAKERKAIIVEGQIDCLRLIQEGFDYTVAGQGTAFGEGHVKEMIILGVNVVYLALDSDNAGREAAVKIGDFFQKEGVDVYVIQLPDGKDPDSFLREEGPRAFENLLAKGLNYLSFIVEHLSASLNQDSPAAKAELIGTIAARIREWKNPLMVHESLRRLAKITQIPEESLGIGQEYLPQTYIKTGARIGVATVDPNRILEMDLLRLLLLFGEENKPLIEFVAKNVSEDHFTFEVFKRLFRAYLEAYNNGGELDLLSLAISVNDEEAQDVMSEILQKKVNKERIQTHIQEAIQKVLERSWMQEREEIRAKIQGSDLSDDEALQLAKLFDQLRKNPPKVLL